MKSFMVDVSSCTNDDILPNVIGVVVIFDHLPGNGLHVVNITKNGESHLMVFINTTMGDFQSGLKRLTFLSLQ